MSDDCVLTRRHTAYIAEHTRGDDQLLVDLKKAALEAGIPSIAISAPQASLMQVVLKLHRAREVVEVGTLAGYSAITMARALPSGGRVTTIELEPKHADFAEAWIAKSDVADKVKVLRGAGVDVLKTLRDNSADACFLDADKENYPRYLDECLRIVRVGGLIMADNAMAFGQLFADVPSESGVAAVRRFNDYIASHPQVHGTIAPIGDGCWIAIRES